ncbi:A/G-specific adenine glycosylase [Pseudidiomarina terrestris]|uniref:Adenine DNA glycosylase n=1 Tax=Pseudidiomarina terrestris TaxID=2820060 RepID=A0AAW7QU44_9GAMM|nr:MULTISPECIES: A/G-specific adenine glycosylase [unclassified Pseudidiomarina]MDN7123791.1 A/G-specific adenine glycosylase [Pseudidiomarina sp. 1APP75-32.1]MDN7127545.1 A/G-specific adenine glycosylase [Pseudidiomarina sp. 1APR75-33.1]MDN7130291.1 A/G-specific adenine glycosylase [Pseudidiomarina sp. 1APR75-15]MDN7136214.1 A/G-specific adenine glycosylase [Pseudidiomarina sp. 1ASP75-5]
MQSIDYYVRTAKQTIAPANFSRTVIDWQQTHGRNDLPWQREANPYHVLVSELMLQQTQVKTVIPYFSRWLARFPDVETLAAASEDDVMQLWQGLGYYRRARNLQAAARTVVNNHNGEIPTTATELREIPGIGPYTVGAIRAFAYDAPAAIVDGNVKRLFARLFALPFLVNKSSHDRYFWALAEEYTPTQENRRFAQGLLDLGATICKPKQPLCAACPLQSVCHSLALDLVDDYPKRETKKATPTRAGHFVLDVTEAGVLLQKRDDSSVWPNLWCLPELAAMPSGDAFGHFKHTFSHYKLEASIWWQPAPDQLRQQRVALDAIDQLGLPAPIRNYLQKLDRREVCQKLE